MSALLEMIKTKSTPIKKCIVFSAIEIPTIAESAAAELAAMQARIEKLAEYPERLQKAIIELRALISPTLSRSEQERIAGKIDGVKIALSYFEEMTK